MESKATKKTKSSKKKSKSLVKSEFGKTYHVMPTAFVPNTRFIYKRRFVASSGVNSALTINDLFNTLIMAATTTLGYSPWYMLRLCKIKLWSPVTTIGTPVTVTLRPEAVETTTNSYGDCPEALTDTSASIDWPAYIQYTPKAHHPSGSWHLSNSTSISLCNIQAVAGTVMDLTLMGVMNVRSGTQGFTSTLVGASAGGLYTRTILTVMVPQGVNTI